LSYSTHLATARTFAAADSRFSGLLLSGPPPHHHPDFRRFSPNPQEGPAPHTRPTVGTAPDTQAQDRSEKKKVSTPLPSSSTLSLADGRVCQGGNSSTLSCCAVVPPTHSRHRTLYQLRVYCLLRSQLTTGCTCIAPPASSTRRHHLALSARPPEPDCLPLVWFSATRRHPSLSLPALSPLVLRVDLQLFGLRQFLLPPHSRAFAPARVLFCLPTLVAKRSYWTLHSASLYV